MPALTVDGKVGPQTRRAICAVRWLTGNQPSTALPTTAERAYLSKTHILRNSLSAIVVNRTCQVLAVNLNKHLTKIAPVSTGKPGHTTPALDSRMDYGRIGWHNSNLYPAEQGSGNMYYPLYVKGAIAIHGSNEEYNWVTQPLSHGCVRVTQAFARTLWKIAHGPVSGEQNSIVHVDPIRTVIQ